MKYLIDTNIIIDYLKGRPQVVSFLQKSKVVSFAVSVISIGEILEGLVGQPKEAKRRKDLENFLAATAVLDVDRKVVERFAQIRADLRREGNLIDNFDILIAATAMQHDLILLTDDFDFERIKGLKLRFIR